MVSYNIKGRCNIFHCRIYILDLLEGGKGGRSDLVPRIVQAGGC